MQYCSLWEGQHFGTEEESEKGGAAERKSYELTITLIPYPSKLLSGRK